LIVSRTRVEYTVERRAKTSTTLALRHKIKGKCCANSIRTCRKSFKCEQKIDKKLAVALFT